MKRLTDYTKLLLAVVFLFGATACSGLIEHFDREICDYTVRLRYDYNEENTAQDNRFDYHIGTLDQYIFDEQGVLVAESTVTRDICDGTWHSDITLPPGRYSVIAVGNKDTRSEITDSRTGTAPAGGSTLRGDMRMTLKNCTENADGTRGPSERLYHGYRTFTITPTGVSSVRVDMVHSHLRLRFRVTWKSNPPADREDYFLTLETVPSQYALMPQYYYPEGTFNCRSHDPSHCDPYRSVCNSVVHHIPYTCFEGSNMTVHRHDTYITNDNELWSEFTSYRLKNDTPARLNIWHWDEDAQTAEKLLTKGIDLRDYLVNFRGFNLDHTLKQDYELAITIDGDMAMITPLKVDDWEEGGTIQP
ncbi:FimB/Mfa2 family fimbrial subunit [Alistipes sp. OttesenSCG-928-B03]|nr:FimB/Mfa2 family fimbrial subunit [Alistipes sp. OttesenSCG-928-B03]